MTSTLTEHAVTRDFDPRELRTALGRYTTGVTVITASTAGGHRIGVTANSFTSVSLEPPLVAWCPAKRAPSLPDLAQATHFAVNVLAAEQHRLSTQFATPAPDKFDGVATTEGLGAAPLIEGALARFQCRPVRWVDAGDHVICIAEVERFDTADGDPLVFHGGAYHVAAPHPEF
ncbi:flavin reductase family protein [Haloechinothrix sp. YIM 98757]|uniref:Flavin reductase family protein n=1 Tax=Haloechinothrix aidingensis TaxID=2752311 RepID=A0A838AE72_9PSEU|nr:flavin reductase family protein [Haloechinothrix aidingensis]MBA0127582.1 flavin reductase family protein [Haloechinothrix aidingensis]